MAGALWLIAIAFFCTAQSLLWPTRWSLGRLWMRRATRSWSRTMRRFALMGGIAEFGRARDVVKVVTLIEFADRREGLTFLRDSHLRTALEAALWLDRAELAARIAQDLARYFTPPGETSYWLRLHAISELLPTVTPMSAQGPLAEAMTLAAERFELPHLLHRLRARLSSLRGDRANAERELLQAQATLPADDPQRDALISAYREAQTRVASA